MFIEVAQAGAISEAPSIFEILIRAIQTVLNFVGVLAVLFVGVSGIVYITSTGNSAQQKLAKDFLSRSIIGLVIALTSLVVVNVLVKIFS